MDENLKRKFDVLMYSFTKTAARGGFNYFLDDHGVDEDEWESIRKYLNATYGVKTYC